MLLERRRPLAAAAAAQDPAELAGEAARLPAAVPARATADAGVRLQASAQGGLDALQLQPVPRRAPARARWNSRCGPPA